MRYIINSLFLLMISVLSANCPEQNTGWSYIQSSEQAFYMFETVGFMNEWGYIGRRGCWSTSGRPWIAGCSAGGSSAGSGAPPGNSKDRGLV